MASFSLGRLVPDASPASSGDRLGPASPGAPSLRPSPRSLQADSPRTPPAEADPNSSRPAPRSSGARARPIHEVVAAPRAHPRRRWPLGSGFHEPDFEAPIDLEAHLALLPPDATCKGLFLDDTLKQACKVTSEAEILRAAQLPERRYIGFRDYPLADLLKLTVATARVLYPRYPAGEGMHRLGQTVFDALLRTHVGRTIFATLGREVEPLVLACPKAFKLLHSGGCVTCDKRGFRAFALRATAFPAFLETYQVGVLEGIVRYCGERSRIQIAMDDLATANLELRLV